MGKVIKREEREERKVKRPEKEKKRKSEDEGEKKRKEKREHVKGMCKKGKKGRVEAEGKILRFSEWKRRK